MLTVKQIPVLNDNYIYLIVDEKTQTSACVDPAISEPVIETLEKQNLSLDFILNTHHHFDHVGANIELKKKYSCKIIGNEKDSKRIPGIDIKLNEGDFFDIGKSKCKIFDVSGHTKGHIAFYFMKENLIFCGDTLFSFGCGRLFEGTPAQMVQSLLKIRSLPDHTKVYCAHEYTLNNANFALSLDPLNKKLKGKVTEIERKRSKNIPTIPCNLGDEKNFNPFLMFDNKDYLKRIGLNNLNDEESFKIIREMKDNF